jgi:exopolyphosphatase/guanosine-5'-triphosphate,3'-diphosphate pyrophosphatase
VPRAAHPEYAALPRADRITVSKLAAILRVANALDREGSQGALACHVAVEPGVLAIAPADDTALAYLRHRVHERADLLREVYGLRVELRGRRR